MARDRKAIIETIRRLLALATSDNIGEAATAAAKAQELMERHAIEEEMVREAERQASGNGGDDDPIMQKVIYIRAGLSGENAKAKGRLPTWVVQLTNGVTTINRCDYVMYSSNEQGRIVGVGTEANLDKSSFLLNWLIGEVDRLYTADKHKQPLMSKGEGKRWANAFRLGASSTIVNRLMEAQAKMQEKMRKGLPLDEDAYRAALESQDTETLLRLDAERNQYALVRVESALVKLQAEPARVADWLKKNIKTRKAKPRNAGGDHEDAYSAGREAGNRANLSGPKGRLTG